MNDPALGPVRGASSAPAVQDAARAHAGRSFRDELWRKGLHLSSAGIPLGYLLVPRPVVLGVVGVLLAAAVLMELLRHFHRPFRVWLHTRLGFLFRDFESREISGATFVLLGDLLAVWLFPRHVAIAAMLYLSICDAVASLVGRRFGRVRFAGKSLEGSAAFFLSAVIIGWLLLPGELPAVLVGALVATVVEALPGRIGPLRLDDNLLIPLIAGTVLWQMAG